MMAMETSSLYNEEQQQQQQRQQEKKASQLFAQRTVFQDQRRLKPPDHVMACPRCQSMNTKFCYYNNYSLTQPRHFCKNCRRYWTAGGTLRNIPVGGGCRKKKCANKLQGQSSGTGNSETYELSAATTATAQQQQHTRLGSSLSSSAAKFFNTETPAGGTMTWSRPLGTIHSTGEAAASAARSSDFDRFTQSSCQAPTSISAGLDQYSSQPFESGSMSLDLFNSVRRRPEEEEAGGGGGGGLCTYPATSQQLVHGGDDHDNNNKNSNNHLCAFFDNPAAYSTRLGGALAALSEEAEHDSYNHTEAHHGEEEDQASSCGRGENFMWRNLQQQPPKKVLWGGQEESIHGSLDLNRQQAKGFKFSTASTSLSSAAHHRQLGDEGEEEEAEEKEAAQPTATRAAAAAAWQQSLSQGLGMPHYETTAPDTNFWSTPGPWPAIDFRALHGSGAQRLL